MFTVEPRSHEYFLPRVPVGLSGRSGEGAPGGRSREVLGLRRRDGDRCVGGDRRGFRRSVAGRDTCVGARDVDAVAGSGARVGRSIASGLRPLDHAAAGRGSIGCARCCLVIRCRAGCAAGQAVVIEPGNRTAGGANPRCADADRADARRADSRRADARRIAARAAAASERERERTAAAIGGAPGESANARVPSQRSGSAGCAAADSPRRAATSRPDVSSGTGCACHRTADARRALSQPPGGAPGVAGRSPAGERSAVARRGTVVGSTPRGVSRGGRIAASIRPSGSDHDPDGAARRPRAADAPRG